MALTLAQAETLLVRRCGKSLALVGLTADAQADASPRAYLADPIAEGLRSLGLPTADPTAPADGDLAGVGPGDLAQLLDVAELRCLDTVLGNWDEPDSQAGTDRQDWGKLYANLLARAEALRKRAQDLYGYGTPPVSMGTIDLNFAESGDPNDWTMLS